MSYIKNMFKAKILRRRGGQIRRTVASLPKDVTVAKIVQYAVANGYGFRVDHGQIFVFT
jgi:hypothetical protein